MHMNTLFKYFSYICIPMSLAFPLNSLATPASFIELKAYYKNDKSDAMPVNTPIKTQVIRKFTLFDKTISYRNNKKAKVEFKVPKEIMRETNQIEMILEAYNDDATFDRAIWFEVDGVGGYIGAIPVAPQQYRGGWILSTQEQNKWKIDLSKVFVSHKNSGKLINFYQMLKKPGPHKISCWISTYEQYGPDSWVSIELILK